MKRIRIEISHIPALVWREQSDFTETDQAIKRIAKRTIRRKQEMIVKEPQEVFWGGYHAYFADLDGYYWEVAWGPDFKYDDNGLLQF